MMDARRCIIRLMPTPRYGIVLLAMVATFLMYSMINDTDTSVSHHRINSINTGKQDKQEHLPERSQQISGTVDKSLMTLLDESKRGDLSERGLWVAISKRLLKRPHTDTTENTVSADEDEDDPDLVDPKKSKDKKELVVGEEQPPEHKPVADRLIVKHNQMAARLQQMRNAKAEQEKVAAERPVPPGPVKKGHGLKALKSLNYNVARTDKARRLPQCIILGVKKCGTYALRNFLSLHPNVVAHKLETHFFDRPHILIQGLEKYRRMMPQSWPNQTTVEGSPSYFVTPGAPELMFSMNSSVRLVVVVRDPTERAISDYQHSKSFGEDRSGLPFETQAINSQTGEVNSSYHAVAKSMYAIHLPRWLAVFPRNQLHFVSGENLVDNPVEELEKVEDFLNLPHFLDNSKFVKDPERGFYCMKTASGAEECLPKAKGKAHPDVDQIVVEKLHKFFKPYNEKFYQMVGQRFHWSE